MTSALKKLEEQKLTMASNLSFEELPPHYIHGPILEQASIQNGQEVMQVIVVHLDLFMCGTCGKQSTDILEHVLHKSQHPTSSVYACELCKLVYPCRQALLQHYSGLHSLPKLQDVATETREQAEQVLVIANNKEPLAKEQIEQSPFLSWNRNGQADTKEKTPNGHGDAPFIYAKLGENAALSTVLHDHGIFCEKDKKDFRENTGGKLSSRVKSKQLLKTAKRTLTHSKTLGSEVHSSQPACARVMSRKPPILQRHAGLSLELKKEAHPAVNVSPTKPKVRRKSQSSLDANVSLLEIIEDEVRVNLNQDSVSGEIINVEPKEKAQCLHCDFASHNRDELTHHMNTKHKQVLELPDSIQTLASVEDSPIKRSDRIDGSGLGSLDKKGRKNRQPRKVERQDLPGVYPCNQCGKSFMRLRYLRKHAHVHRTERKFVCEECGKLFKCKGYLNVHQRKMHEGQEKVFKCNQCEFESSINAAIHAHRQIHSQGSVLCDICGYAYTDKATLAKHKRVHDPRRPFACNFPGCMWRFKTEIMCKAHIRAHTTEGKFRCGYCGYVFRHKHHLQRHAANMHGVKHDKSRQQSIKEMAPIDIDKYDSGDFIEDRQESIITVSNDFTTAELELGDGDLPHQFLVIKPEEEVDAIISYTTADMVGLNCEPKCSG